MPRILTSPRFIIVFIFAVLGTAGFLYWKHTKVGFPVLSIGSYSGTLEFKRQALGMAPSTFYLERSQAGYLLSVLQKDWPPQFIEGKLQNEGANPELKVSSPHGVLVLRGNEAITQPYYGKIFDEKGEDELGTWQLSAIEETANPTDSATLEHLRMFVMLSAQRAELVEQSKTAEITVKQQKEEIDKLAQFITEGESLKHNANRKFEEATNELEKLKHLLEQKRSEAKDLSDKLLLSQRFTEMGRLVSLARESLERENRWTETVLKTSPTDVNDELDSAVARGIRILDLKDRIAKEKGTAN